MDILVGVEQVKIWSGEEQFIMSSLASIYLLFYLELLYYQAYNILINILL